VSLFPRISIGGVAVSDEVKIKVDIEAKKQ
jgi:hypothetical protein